MRLKVSDIVLGILVLLAVFFFFDRFKSDDNQPTIPDSDLSENVESDLEDVLGINIPDEGDKLELSNGDAKAVVTLHDGKISVVADLPDLNPGQEYQVLGIGGLVQAKGGYILNSEISGDIDEIQIVKGEETILRGSF